MIASDGALTADTRGIIADPLTADHRGSATDYQEPTSKDPSCKSQYIGASQGWPSHILL